MSLSQSELVGLAYGAVLVFVLAYVVIIAAKLARLERETAELAKRARDRRTEHEPAAEAVLADVSGDA